MLARALPGHPWGYRVLFAAFVLLAVMDLPLARGDVAVIDIDQNRTITSFADMQAGFGSDFPEDGLEGFVVYAKPHTACTKLLNPAPKEKGDYKWILLIARGDSCQFADKVLNAQNNNYDAAIVHDDRQESHLPVMGGVNGSKVHIPSTFVGLDSGQMLAGVYNATSKKYIVRIQESPQFDYKMYLWPFAIVVAVCFLMVMIFLIVKFVREHTKRRLNRLSSKHLKKIPVRKYKKGDYYDTCAICLDEYEDGEKIRVLPCDHVYHTKCIDPWLTKNKKTCPVCKRRVIPGRDADSEDSDSDSDGGSRAESTPLLRGGPSSNPARSAYGGATSAPGASAEVHEETETPQATGGVGISDIATTVTAEVKEETRGPSRSERRRRRHDRERRQDREQRQELASGQVDQGEEDGGAVGGAAALGLAENVARELQREETREERRERKRKKKEAKRKRRADNAPRVSEVADGDRQTLLDDDTDEFVSAHSSFREVDQGSDDLQKAELERQREIEREREEERQRELEREREGYINPSYSESQEVTVAGSGKRELNEVV
ncbi:E3 ubiquitin-protein ligase RNF13 [Aplysia californica]|uniref:E3 ubiquitin-protein ligase RNF13 n=1 Tax=Aplysia californica TaxID=6500 RepID=A0ABM0JZP6_APLCA|nr:E3 ubiquitin-protein ligase RNF13 [Aplysia californica]XP_005105319.1 E3 ubiquitin-protein ligase RNF13 [Aplysia californica]